MSAYHLLDYCKLLILSPLKQLLEVFITLVPKIGLAKPSQLVSIIKNLLSLQGSNLHFSGSKPDVLPITPKDNNKTL